MVPDAAAAAAATTGCRLWFCVSLLLKQDLSPLPSPSPQQCFPAMRVGSCVGSTRAAAAAAAARVVCIPSKPTQASHPRKSKHQSHSPPFYSMAFFSFPPFLFLLHVLLHTFLISQPRGLSPLGESFASIQPRTVAQDGTPGRRKPLKLAKQQHLFEAVRLPVRLSASRPRWRAMGNEEQTVTKTYLIAPTTPRFPCVEGVPASRPEPDQWVQP